VSDGLFADLLHIADQSAVALELELDAIPLSSQFCQVFRDSTADRAIQACSFGEDYELAFTASPDHRNKIESLMTADCPVTRIGRVVAESEQLLSLSYLGEQVSLPTEFGFDHFS
jgi:thiamine-monophosphate kinase